MKLYGKEKSEEEIINFVKDYVAGIRTNKYDRFHSILSLIPEGGKHILDYGCGWGHYSVAMRDKGNIVKAIDISQNEIDICKLVWGTQNNISFENKAMRELEDESFDCVLSNQVIEHVHNVGNYLSEINRVLKKGGQLVISLPNVINPRSFVGLIHGNMEERLRKRSKEYLCNYDKTHDHINAWDPPHFVNLAASTGFLMEKYIPTEGVALPFRKPFKPYIFTKNKIFKNFSYTMTFSFKKIHYIKIKTYD